jgi:hypothetical protein
MAIAQTNWINHLMDLLQICSGVEDITKEISLSKYQWCAHFSHGVLMMLC